MRVPTGALVIQMARDSQQTHEDLIAVPCPVTDPKYNQLPTCMETQTKIDFMVFVFVVSRFVISVLFAFHSSSASLLLALLVLRHLPVLYKRSESF